MVLDFPSDRTATGSLGPNCLKTFDGTGKSIWRKGETLTFSTSRSTSPRRPLASTTLRQQQEHLRLAASILIKEQGVAADKIKSLSDLISPEAFKAILRHYHGKQPSGTPNAFAVSLAKTLIQVAKFHGGIADKEIARLRAIASKLPEIPFDLTPKNRTLIRQLEPDETRAKLLFLPERLLNDVAKDLKDGRFRFVDAQCGIAIDILLAMPLRPQNLSALHWRRHF